MKFHITYLLAFLILTGCKKETNLTFEPNILTHKDCSDCPSVSISIPRAMEKSKLAKAINTALNEEIISLLRFDDEMEVTTLDEAITSFKKGYLDLKKRYTDEPAGWEATIEGKVVYEDASLLTIELNSYLFTGGAHGYSTQRFLNFDRVKGAELENWQLFTNKADFQRYAEQKFREQEAIPNDKSINHTGLMFEKDSFYLPENIGYTDAGVKLLYNPYEVASFADGPIILTLPYKEVDAFLVAKVKS